MSSESPSVAPVETAYPAEEAARYDEKRFTDGAGKRIHRFEMDCLHWGVAKATKQSRLIEVGCGTGRLLVELLDKGYDVTGVDASDPMLNQLREKLLQRGVEAELYLAEGAATGRPSDHYDFVYSIRVLNQTESPEYALRMVKELIRIAKPSGHVLIEFVNDYRPRWGAAAKTRTIRSSVTRLRPHQVANAIEEGGGRTLGYKGCFLLSMQAYKKSPSILLPIVSLADRVLSALLPRLCARTYVLAQKRDS
ncbi:MAG: class I SAM-dependent methyltransferase [Rubripirellula sp.]